MIVFVINDLCGFVVLDVIFICLCFYGIVRNVKYILLYLFINFIYGSNYVIFIL